MGPSLVEGEFLENVGTSSLRNFFLLRNSYIMQLGHATKSDEFLEKFQTAFDPPLAPSFSSIMLQIF